MRAFDIHPFAGALPVEFGMKRAVIHKLLGKPEVTHSKWDGSGLTDYWNASGVNVGYTIEGRADHIGFCSGEYELLLEGAVLWPQGQQPDPNPELLRRDPDPVEALGFLVFTQLGITTAGYHDEDENQRALTVFPRGSWDGLLQDARRPTLSKYQR